MSTAYIGPGIISSLVTPLLLLLSISPRSLSGVDLDIPEHEADDACSSLDSSLVLSCTKTPAAIALHY